MQWFLSWMVSPAPISWLLIGILAYAVLGEVNDLVDRREHVVMRQEICALRDSLRGRPSASPGAARWPIPVTTEGR